MTICDFRKTGLSYTCACEPARDDAGPGERIVKTLLLALAIAGAAVRPALAEPCVVLEYQEMKDMSADDIVKEACKTNTIKQTNFDHWTASSSRLNLYPEAERDHDQCKGQLDRIRRVMQAKGITEKLYVLCSQQAAGKVIEAPAAPSK